MLDAARAGETKAERMGWMPAAGAARRFLLGGGLRWSTAGAHWPHQESSRFVRAAGLRWHVQQLGAGPTLLLLHGTGASTHSWRDLLPRLARSFRVVALDLPGHAFTEAPGADGYSLPAMSGALAQLLALLDCRPSVVVGHSAGAAIACRMCLDAAIAPERIIGLNGALLPLGGNAESWLSQMGRAMTWTPLLPALLAWRGRDPRVVARMLRGTGSRLDEEGIELYAQLLRDPRHVASALRMMASWELTPLFEDLPALAAELTLVVGDLDRYISPSQSRRVLTRVPRASRVVLRGLGHLAHEESPERIASLIVDVARPGEGRPDADRRGSR